MNSQDWLAERFEEQRRHLRAVAYRMLGSLSEADDAVQEAWLRLARSDVAEIDNLGAWLTTVVARVSLNMLRSRANRREQALGPYVPEPIVDSAAQMANYGAATAARRPLVPQHTTLCVVATNMTLERGELSQLARAAGAALFRRITPVGTSFDGDVVFALCPPDAERGTLMPLELLAASALEEAIERGVRLAVGRDGVPGLGDTGSKSR